MERADAKRAQVLDALENPQQAACGRSLLVGDAMTVAPTCISPKTTALELIKLFHAKQFRHLLVTDVRARLIGVVSDRDVIRCLGPDRPDRSLLAGITASELMSRDLVTIDPDVPLHKAVTLMVDEGISCLPVLAEGALVGILTNTDLHLALQVLLQTLQQSSSEKLPAAPVPDPQN